MRGSGEREVGRQGKAVWGLGGGLERVSRAIWPSRALQNRRKMKRAGDSVPAHLVKVPGVPSKIFIDDNNPR